MALALDLCADMPDFTVRQHNCANRVKLSLFRQQQLSH